MTRPRAEFSRETKRQAYERSKDDSGVARCECTRVPQLRGIGCTRPLATGDIRYEHIICDVLGGESSLDNCAVLCVTCWRLKTGSYDLRVIPKAKRVADLHLGIRQRPSGRRLPGGRDDSIRIKLNGSVVDRRTGEPRRLR